jgi:hypothetical protein
MESYDIAPATWRKSTYSATTHCVEVAKSSHGVGVRDSKQPDGLVLRYPSAGWSAFLDGLRRGDFDPC